MSGIGKKHPAKDGFYWCAKCASFKSKKAFGRRNHVPVGIRNICKACHSKQRKVHRKVQWAIRVGLLKREPCEKCGTDKVHAHHDDYRKWYSVRWLCSSCHVKHHLAAA